MHLVLDIKRTEMRGKSQQMYGVPKFLMFIKESNKEINTRSDTGTE